MADTPQQPDETALTLLDDEQFDGAIRRVLHEGRLFFSVIDVVGALTDSAQPRVYWAQMKRRLADDEGFSEVFTKCKQLKMPSPDGKQRLTDAADTETLLRIVMNVPSPKAEHIKQWLARVGTERLEEIADPSLTMERARKGYVRQGYSSEWSERRVQGQVIHDELVEEWHDRGVSRQRDYRNLTGTIHHGTFDLTVNQHKEIKGLRASQNLRDNETVLELLVTAIGEATAKEMHQDRKSQGYDQLERDARDAGAIGGATRREIETGLGRSIISPENAKTLRQGRQQELQPPLLDVQSEE